MPNGSLAREELSDNRMKFYSLLKSLASQSVHHRSQHAAVVAKGKSVLGTGFNVEGHHAEAQALHGAWGRTKGTTMYTLMVRKKSKTLGDGTPCSTCMELIRKAKLRRVIIYV